ncbi:MAG: HlyD family secretion protein [Ruminococcus flavefaciens]|nr:HlyD family secretion protein [Ruminococcus flavefaciens]
MKKQNKILLICLGTVIVLGCVATLAFFFRPNTDVGVSYDDDDFFILQYDEISQYVSASGSVQSAIEINVMSPYTGLVEELYAKTGDTVKEGDVLLRFSTASDEAELATLQVMYQQESERINYEHSINQRNLDQAIALQEESVAKASQELATANEKINSVNQQISDIRVNLDSFDEQLNTVKDEEQMTDMTLKYQTYIEQLELLETLLADCELTVSQAQNQYDETVRSCFDNVQAMQDILDAEQFDTTLWTLQTQMDEIQQRINNAEVLVPVSGVLAELYITAGESCISEKIAVIVSTEQLIVELQVDELEINNVEVGMPILFYLGREKKEYKGKVSRISSIKEPEAATYKVEASIEETSLMIGTKVNAKICTDTHSSALIVPYNCIHTDDSGNFYVYKVRNEENGKTENYVIQIQVMIGISTQNSVEIISKELKEGDKLLIKDQAVIR